MSEYMTQENRFDFEKVLMLPNPGVAMHDALEELKRCYEKIDTVDQLVCLLDELLDTDNMTFSKREEIGDPSHLWGILTSYFFEG